SPTPRWSYSTQKDLKILATWSISDPNKCIQQLDTVGDRISSYSDLNLNNFVYKYVYPRKELPTVWQFFRDNDQVISQVFPKLNLTANQILLSAD
ncbi:MAG: hypothetical protein ACKO86_24390, partial [Dolichospermum sp.]